MPPIKFRGIVSVLSLMSIPTVVTPGILFLALSRIFSRESRPISWFVVMSYLLFFYFDRKTPSTTPRTSTLVRSMPLWEPGREYFYSQTLPRRFKLSPRRTYLFTMHPHGIFCYSVWVNYVSQKLFDNPHEGQGHQHLANIPVNFNIPVMRDVMSSVGLVPATKQTLLNLLTTQQHTAMLLGGSAEAAHQSDRSVRLVLASRFGFLRVCLEANAPALIIFHFGENKTFHSPFESTVRENTKAAQRNTPWFTKMVQRFQMKFLKLATFALPLSYGQFGLLPFSQTPLTTVIHDTPLDFRVFAELYYFLKLNNLFLGYAASCPVCFEQQHLQQQQEKQENQQDHDSSQQQQQYQQQQQQQRLFSHEAFPIEYDTYLAQIEDSDVESDTDDHQQGQGQDAEKQTKNIKHLNNTSNSNTTNKKKNKKKHSLKKVSTQERSNDNKQAMNNDNKSNSDNNTDDDNNKQEKTPNGENQEQQQQQQQQEDQTSSTSPQYHHQSADEAALVATLDNHHHATKKSNSNKKNVISIFKAETIQIPILPSSQYYYNTNTNDNITNNTNTNIIDVTNNINNNNNNNLNNNNNNTTQFKPIDIQWSSVDNDLIYWLLLIYIGELYLTWERYSIFNGVKNNINDDCLLELVDFNPQRYVQHNISWFNNALSGVMGSNVNNNENHNNENNISSASSLPHPNSYYQVPTCTCLYQHIPQVRAQQHIKNNNNKANNNKKQLKPINFNIISPKFDTNQYAYKYKYGIEVADYLALHQYNRGYILAQLGQYLKLKEQYNLKNIKIDNLLQQKQKQHKAKL